MKHCRHKTQANHGVRRDDGRFVWRCSICGAQDFWRDGWTYYGNLECRNCQTAKIDVVYCPACVPAEATLESP